MSPLFDGLSRLSPRYRLASPQGCGNMSPMKRALVWVGLLVAASWGCSDPGDGRREPSTDDERRGADEAASVSRDETGPVGAESLSPNGSSEESDAAQSDAYPSDRDAYQSDLESIAEARGWTLEEAQLYQDKTDAAGEVSERLSLERPDVFVGGAVGPEPSDAPRMYIKGVADDGVYAIVGAAPFEIRVIDRQPYSRDDIDQRQSLLADELLALGFLNFAIGTDIQREGLMEATVQRTEGAPGSVEELLAALPASLRERISVRLIDEPAVTLN
jgi:hypothetical protein